MWDIEVVVEIVNYSQHHIHARIVYEEKMFTGFS